MRLDHEFTVPAPVDEAWTVLLDVPRVAPCMPGAALTEFDGEAFSGTVKVKLGPVSLTYRGTGRFVEVDEAARRVVIEASGKENRGSGTASATVTASLTSEGDGATRVDVGTDLTITGRPAQFGRGMLNDVGERLIGQFADCLAGTLAGSGEQAGAGEPGAEAEAGSDGAVPTAAGPAAAPASGPTGPAAGHPDSGVDSIDVLEVTGIGDTARRYAPYAVAGVVGLLLLAIWARRRRGRRARGF